MNKDCAGNTSCVIYAFLYVPAREASSASVCLSYAHNAIREGGGRKEKFGSDRYSIEVAHVDREPGSPLRGNVFTLGSSPSALAQAGTVVTVRAGQTFLTLVPLCAFFI